MSEFSGKGDLYDHISGLGGWFDKDGNPVTFGQEGVNVYYSDEFKDFEAFKEKTGGVIYQHKHIKNVTSWNHDFIKENCPQFDYIEHEIEYPDKRYKSGVRKEKNYTYIYYGKEYTADELNKSGGVYLTVEIHFDNILHLIKYYPYIVSAACCNKDKHTIFIANESFVEEEYDEHLKYGYNSSMRDFYNHRLAEHYFEISKELLKREQ